MTKKLFALLAMFAFACGAVDDDSGEPTDDSGELGQVEEAILTGNGGYGFANTTAKLACAQPGPSGQDCLVSRLTSGVVKYCIDDSGAGFSSAVRQGIRDGVTLTDANSTNWVFNEVAFTDGTCQLKFVNSGTSGDSGVGNIDDFTALIPFSGSAPLTSPPGAGHVNGTWRSFKELEVRYNANKASLQGPLVDQIYAKHVGGNGSGHLMGLGTRTTGDYNSSQMRRFVSVTTGIAGLTIGDRCRVNALNTTSPTTISANTGCGI